MEKRKKALLALTIGMVLVLVATTVARYSVVHAEQVQSDALAEAAIDDATNEVIDATGDGSLTEDSKLPGGDVIEVLKTNVWGSSDGLTSIVFKDGRYVESDGASSAMTTFDVGEVAIENDQTAIVLKVDCPDATVKDSLLLLRHDMTGALTISSDDFVFSKTYRQGLGDTGPLSIEGVNSEFRELLGGTTDTLVKALSDYAHIHAPSATMATWDESLVVDYTTGTVSANFALNDAARTLLTVEYVRATSVFTVMG